MKAPGQSPPLLAGSALGTACGCACVQKEGALPLSLPCLVSTLPHLPNHQGSDWCRARTRGALMRGGAPPHVLTFPVVRTPSAWQMFKADLFSCGCFAESLSEPSHCSSKVCPSSWWPPSPGSQVGLCSLSGWSPRSHGVGLRVAACSSLASQWPARMGAVQLLTNATSLCPSLPISAPGAVLP